MRWILVIFLVPVTICSANVAISPDLLESVFGNPTNVSIALAAPAQAKPISPEVIAALPEYSDFVDPSFIPSVTDYDKFDWTLTKRVAFSSNDNFLLSPLGLKLALAILTEAATGATQTELSSVLGFDTDSKVVRRKFEIILNSLRTKSSHYLLNLASRIYVSADVIPLQHFASLSEKYYKTEIKSLDFVNPVSAAYYINEWVNSTTGGKISDLVNSDDVSGVSALVLNTIFFKGTWQRQFNPNATKIDMFYTSATEKKEALFMSLREKFFYAESTKFNAKILRMPYLGNKFAMYIIIPNSLTGLSEIFNELTQLRSELYYLQEFLVDVKLPKFQFEYTAIMDGILRELGIRQAFDDTASFPGISRGQTLSNRVKISRVLQRSGIEVNELGSVAYSATGVVVAVCIQSISSNAVPQEISRLNFFDTDLLRYAAEDKKGNVMVSPASIKSTLAMILESASGDTEAEIRSALRLSPYKAELREQLNLYLVSLNANSPGVTLQNSNSVFVSKRLKLRKEFEQTIRNVYYADVCPVDFSDSLTAADTINKWVNQHTKGLIPNIVESTDINPLSDALISNALYFKGHWRNAFNPRYTRTGCFHVDNSCQNAIMMELHEDMNYGFVDNLRAHAIELPYEGLRYSMIVLVPLDKGNLNTLIRDLPYMSLPQISELMEPTNVRLFMPKFTVDYSDSMVSTLRNMKINALFTKNASLPGMFENGAPQVNDIIHKVYMSVDETGTVAAAATSAMVIPLIEDGVQLKVDRPFLFFIRDNELGLILFAGKIDEPLAFVEDKVLSDPPRQASQTLPPQSQRYWYS